MTSTKHGDGDQPTLPGLFDNRPAEEAWTAWADPADSEPEPSSGLRMEMSLRDARTYLRRRMTDGAVCPCCDRHAQIYRRRLNSTMARGLLWLVQAAGQVGAFVDVPARAPRWLVKTNQLSTGKYWGLLAQAERAEGQRGKTSGIWRPTLRGIHFALDRIRIPAYVYHYNDTALGFSASTTNIHGALGAHFDYDSMIGASTGRPAPWSRP